MITIKGDSEQAKRALNEVSQSAKQMGKEVTSAGKSTEVSAKEATKSWSALATSGYALYQIYDRIDDASLRLQRSQYSLAKANNAVEDAQRRLNNAIAKFGEGSEQAEAASKDYQLALERQQVAQAMADEAQEHMNEALVQAALFGVPTLITALGNLRTAYTSLGSVVASVNASISATSGLAAGLGTAGIIGLAAGGLLAGGYVAAKAAGITEKPREWWEAGGPWTTRAGDRYKFPGVDTSEYKQGMREVGDITEAVMGDSSVIVTTKLDEMSKVFGETAAKIVTRSIWPEMWRKIRSVTEEYTSKTEDRVNVFSSRIESALQELADKVAQIFDEMKQSILNALNEIEQGANEAVASIRASLAGLGGGMTGFLGGFNIGVSRYGPTGGPSPWAPRPYMGTSPYAGMVFPQGGWQYPIGIAQTGEVTEFWGQPWGEDINWNYPTNVAQEPWYQPYVEPFWETGNWLSQNIVNPVYDWLNQNIFDPFSNWVGSWWPFQEGGVVTRPTLGLLGERGREAVIPLNQAGGFGFGQSTFNFTININEMIDAKDPHWKHELAVDIMRMAYDATKRGVGV